MTLSRACTLILTVTAWLAAAAPVTAERQSKLDKALREAARHSAAAQRVIIQTRPGTRAALKRSLKAHGDVIESDHPSLNALTVNLHAADLAALEANPNVLAISIDAEVTTLGAGRREAKYDARQAARDARAEADAAKATLTAAKKTRAFDQLRRSLGLDGLAIGGSGVSVAVLDSGIDPNRDLAANIYGFWDFTRGGVPVKAFDDYGHGTHVAGLIASTGALSNKEFTGVAPAARLYGFKVLDSKGRGRTSDVVKAIEFIVANRHSADPSAVKIDVINLSLGHPIFEPAATDPLVIAVEQAVRAGIVVVTAAGNVGQDELGTAGYAGILSPGNAPSAITVGAADNKLTESIADDRVASFSSRGPSWFDGFAKPDVVAPGVGLVSDAARAASLFTMYPELKKTSIKGTAAFARLSGTSMAAAVATGVVALTIDASRGGNPEGALTPNALKAVMQYTATPLRNDNGNVYDALTQGTGLVNARGALQMAAAINTAMPAGAPWLRGPVAPTTTIAGTAVRWSQALIWDDNIVWGTDALSFNAAQWDDNIVWGTALACEGCDNIVCGTSADLDNIVWGTVTDPDNIVWGTVFDGDNIVWGTSLWAGSLVWGNRVVGLMTDDGENIVWGTFAGLDADNIVWGTLDGDNIVWGTCAGDGDNIVWGTTEREDIDNIVWGTLFGDADNIVWGTVSGVDDNIVWGTSLRGGTVVMVNAGHVLEAPAPLAGATLNATVSTDWRESLPVLTAGQVTLRELRLTDAASLCVLLSEEEVSRFISPPPSTVEGFERFIAWTHRERAAGRYICFAVVPHGLDYAVGLFQVRQLDPGFATAEWGFAIGSSFWGTGVFMDGAQATMEFVFETVGVHRLEARAAVANGRGNGALAKVGATREGVLRASFLRRGAYLDQVLWAMLREDWYRSKAVWGSKVH